MPGDFTVVVDTREQKPYRFRNAVTKTLKAGDYSVEGMERRIAVERKSKQDAYSSLGKGRARLQREFRRLAEFEYAAVVIEASLSDFLRPPAFSKMVPKAAVNTLVSWSITYGVHVFFADGRRLARALTYRILEKYAKHTAWQERLHFEFDPPPKWRNCFHLRPASDPDPNTERNMCLQAKRERGYCVRWGVVHPGHGWCKALFGTKREAERYRREHARVYVVVRVAVTPLYTISPGGG